MKREPHGPELLSPPAEQIEFALARMEHSAAFRGSSRHRALLRHLVSRMLGDEVAALKESVIAVEVFGRPAATFDPKLDTIVRVEARRLRARLSNYYRDEGRDAPIRIELPVGSYVPQIIARDPMPHGSAVTRHARDLVERGEHYLRQSLSREGLEAALERFDAALRESPDYADAYVGMGRAWLNLAVAWYHPPAQASAHASEALRRAVDLAPGNAIAHALLAALQHQFEHDWAAARRGFERALALEPEQAFVHSAYGCHLYMHGSLDEAERELLLARRLDPLYINARNHMVNLRIAQRRLDAAEAELLAICDIAPASMAIAGLRGAIAMFRREPEAAVRHYEQACGLMPEHAACHIALAAAHALAGHADIADALLAETLERFEPHRISPFALAIFETRRGRADTAFALLDRAHRERDPYAMQIGADPSFEDLHTDQRWSPLLRRLRDRRSQPLPG